MQREDVARLAAVADDAIRADVGALERVPDAIANLEEPLAFGIPPPHLGQPRCEVGRTGPPGAADQVFRRRGVAWLFGIERQPIAEIVAAPMAPEVVRIGLLEEGEVADDRVPVV